MLLKYEKISIFSTSKKRGGVFKKKGRGKKGRGTFFLKRIECTLTSHVWSKLRFSNIGRGFLPFKALCAGAGAAGGFLPPKQPADRRRTAGVAARVPPANFYAKNRRRAGDNPDNDYVT